MGKLVVANTMLPFVPPQVVGLVAVPEVRVGTAETVTIAEPVISVAEQLAALASTV